MWVCVLMHLFMGYIVVYNICSNTNIYMLIICPFPHLSFHPLPVAANPFDCDSVYYNFTIVYQQSLSCRPCRVISKRIRDCVGVWFISFIYILYVEVSKYELNVLNIKMPIAFSYLHTRLKSLSGGALVLLYSVEREFISSLGCEWWRWRDASSKRTTKIICLRPRRDSSFPRTDAYQFAIPGLFNVMK